MRIPVSFLLVLASIFAHAQANITLYYTKGWELTKRDSAKFIRTATYDTLDYVFNGPVEDKYINGNPQMKGGYASGSKEGEFTFYHENGKVESVGHFESNSRSGTWKYYFRNGKPRMELDFAPVFGNEPIINFLNDSTGKRLILDGTGKWFEIVDLARGTRLTITGEYKNNEKNGKWEVRSKPGKNLIIEHFNKGRFLDGYVRIGSVGETTYEPLNYAHQVPDKLAITEAFMARPGIDFATYPELKVMQHGQEPVVNYIWDEGEPVYLKIETPATAPGGLQGLYQTLSSIMQYPEEAQIMGIQGKVYIQFVIEKDGSLKRFKIIKGIGGGCDEEVLRVLEDYASKFKWTPAIHNGRVVKQLMLLGLLFQMGQ